MQTFLYICMKTRKKNDLEIHKPFLQSKVS